MVVIDDLFLLLTTDDGKLAAQTSFGPALVAAAVTDLVLHHRVELTPDRDPRMLMLDTAPVGHAALDRVLDRLAQKPEQRLSRMVSDHGLNLRELVASTLEQNGVLGPGERSVLGLGPRHHRVLDPAPEQQTRARLAAVLAGQAQPSPADAILLALLQATRAAPKILRAESRGLSRKELKQRIEEVAGGVEAAEAVKHSIDAMQAALVAAVIVPVITTST